MSVWVGWLVASAVTLTASTGSAEAIKSATVQGDLAFSADTSGIGAQLCDVLTDSVEQQKGTGPAFVASYLVGPEESQLEGPLKTTAFVYDNALVAIALVGCGNVEPARRIGDGFLAAQNHDRSFKDGRIRNAYRAGPAPETPVALPGWYDVQTSRWQEDEYQASTATGNVAWAALALLRLHEATGDTKYLDGARRLIRWIAEETYDPSAPAGYLGGYSGFEPKPQTIRWKSTEHNIDVMAASRWLGQVDPDPRWQHIADSAQRFVSAMNVDGKGFQIGTTRENQPAGYAVYVLDAQLWPSMARIDPPPSWVAALEVAIAELGVDGGFDFNGDRDGLWTEGTAQAALAFTIAGRSEAGAQYLDAAFAEIDPRTGWLYASKNPYLTTGLSIGPAGGEPFLYFRRPHIGATAWAVLAALQINPFLPSNADPNSKPSRPPAIDKTTAKEPRL